MKPKYIATCIKIHRKNMKLTLGKKYDVIFNNTYREPHMILIVNNEGKEVWYRAAWFEVREV